MFDQELTNDRPSEQARLQLEDERRALAAFVTKFDSLTSGLSSTSLSGLSNTPPARTSKLTLARLPPIVESPLRMDLRAEPSLLEEMWDGGMAFEDDSFDADRAMTASSPKRAQHLGKGVNSPNRGVLGGKENLPL